MGFDVVEDFAAFDLRFDWYFGFQMFQWLANREASR